MAHDESAAPISIGFETDPSKYVHFSLDIKGRVAWLHMNVQEDRALREGAYPLKLNSYDLGVDIELADAIQRLRFEHPEVAALVIGSALDRVFCSGANIYMLGSSTHAFKVNFCKFTNETRLDLEDLASQSGVFTLAALNGIAAGGGYELALACEKILLVDDGNSAVSFPEAPLLGVLPGTGGLTRLVDKRKVRRDRADVFSTLVEGIRGKRSVEWGLVDRLVPKSRWNESVQKEVEEALLARPEKKGKGITLTPLSRENGPGGVQYEYVTLSVDAARHIATLTIRSPLTPQPKTSDELRSMGAKTWLIQAFRELDDALLQLRFWYPTIGLVVVATEGSADAVLEAERSLLAMRDDWLAKEVVLLMRRVLRRFDLTARSFFAVVKPGSCFAGSLLELLLAADRSYMLNDSKRPTALFVSAMNDGRLSMWNGLSRLSAHFLGEPERVGRVLSTAGPIDASHADDLGLVTFIPDDLDWDDEVRIAIEERANFSPDAMTGMEANLRFCGPETTATKIFGRLSAWQNWIFQRPNAVGEKGALTSYGKQTRPEFDRTRT